MQTLPGLSILKVEGGTGTYKGPGVEEAWDFKEQEGSFG